MLHQQVRTASRIIPDLCSRMCPHLSHITSVLRTRHTATNISLLNAVVSQTTSNNACHRSLAVFKGWMFMTVNGLLCVGVWHVFQMCWMLVVHLWFVVLGIRCVFVCLVACMLVCAQASAHGLLRHHTWLCCILGLRCACADAMSNPIAASQFVRTLQKPFAKSRPTK